MQVYVRLGSVQVHLVLGRRLQVDVGLFCVNVDTRLRRVHQAGGRHRRSLHHHAVVTFPAAVVLGNLRVRHDLTERRRVQRENGPLVVHEGEPRVVREQRGLNGTARPEHVRDLRSVLREAEDGSGGSGERRPEVHWSG